MTTITHLFLAQSVDTLAGTKKNYTEHKGDPPEMEKFMNQNQNQSEPEPLAITPPILEMKIVLNSCQIKEKPPDFKSQAQFRGRTKQPTPPPLENGQDRGLVHVIQLKGEPPDAPRINKPSPYRGKTLNSQRRMKANLLSLGADYTFSRSKPFQEGEYDAAIKSASSKEHGGDTNQKTNTLAENQPERTKDIYAFIEAYKPNQCWKMTIALFFPCLGFFPMGLPRKVFNEAILSHQGTTETWNWFKSFPHEEDIQVTSQQTSNEPDGDQRLLIGDVRPNHEELSCKPTCDTLFTHQGRFSNWNKSKTKFGLGDMNFLNRRILPHLHLPYPDPILPYSDHHAFNSKRSHFPQPSRVLETLQDNQRLLRTRTFLPKLTRYKEPLTCLIWPISSSKPQRLFSFNLHDLFLVLAP